MSAHDQGSGPRSNRYSENRFTNWTDYEPWRLEVQSVFKRLDDRIAKHPKAPKIVELKPSEGFMRPCSAQQVEVRLKNIPADSLTELRAVFILSGTQKQLRSWKRSYAFYGHYWRGCVFLHAYPYSPRVNLDRLHDFYLNNVLIHEIGHHVDSRNITTKDRERFAERFARRHG